VYLASRPKLHTLVPAVRRTKYHEIPDPSGKSTMDPYYNNNAYSFLFVIIFAIGLHVQKNDLVWLLHVFMVYTRLES